MRAQIVKLVSAVSPEIHIFRISSSKRIKNSSITVYVNALGFDPRNWTFADESLHEAAIRETQEEAGLLEKDYDTVKDFTVSTKYTIRGGRLKSVTYWLAEIQESAQITLSHEHGSWGWFQLDKAIELTEFPSLHNALRQCEVKLRDGST